MTATTAPTKPGRVAASLPRTIRDIIVITKRNLLRNLRLPQLIVLSTIQPIMFLLLFTYVFGGAIGGTLPDAAGGKYINWLIPGLLVQTAVFGERRRRREKHGFYAIGWPPVRGIDRPLFAPASLQMQRPMVQVNFG